MAATMKERLAQRTGWLYTGWRKCEDVGGVPKYLRCMRCFKLCTHGQINVGGCVCGNRRVCPALALTWREALLLKLGWFPLLPSEQQAIRPWSTQLLAQWRAWRYDL